VASPFSTVSATRAFCSNTTPSAPGNFEPLRFVPKVKIVVLGLVSTKVPEIDSVDVLKRRIDEAARYLPLEQLAISPQCGFSPSVHGYRLSQDQQWRKFEVLLETARQVWAKRMLTLPRIEQITAPE
jgi:methionine synthase II (cobalamin-independent)